MILAELLRQYVESIFQLLNIVWVDQNRSEGLMRSAMGVIGFVFPPLYLCCKTWLIYISSDLAETFPQGEYSHLYHAEWITAMIREARTNREFSSRTIETAKWARELVKRQLGGGQGMQQT